MSDADNRCNRAQWFPMSDLINGGLPFVGSDCQTIGLSPVRLRALVVSHEVRRVLRGVYVDARTPDSRQLRAFSLALIRPPGAIFYGATVAFLLGVDVFAPRDRFDFTPQCVVLHHSGRCTRKLVRCREGYLPEEDLLELDGLMVTTPVRTTVDLLRSLWRPHALAAADAMVHAGQVSREEVMAYIRSMRRYPGIIQARALAPLIEPKVESPGESWQRLRLIDAGLPIPDPQFLVCDNAGYPVARLDDAYPEKRVGMEYDGREFHSDDDAVESDETKREILTTILGWRLAIGTYQRIFGDDPSYEQEIGGWIGIDPGPRRW